MEEMDSVALGNEDRGTSNGRRRGLRFIDLDANALDGMDVVVLDPDRRRGRGDMDSTLRGTKDGVGQDEGRGVGHHADS